MLGSTELLQSSSHTPHLTNTGSLVHDTMLAQYMLSPCVHLSVHLLQGRTVPKWINVGSRKQCHTRDSSFLMPKISAKFRQGHPQCGCQIVGRFKSAVFNQYLAISQKRCKTGT